MFHAAFLSITGPEVFQKKEPECRGPQERVEHRKNMEQTGKREPKLARRVMNDVGKVPLLTCGLYVSTLVPQGSNYV